MDRKLLSIIISVYNEEKALEGFFNAFNSISPSFSWDYELLFVNDGSSDESLALLRKYADSNPKAKVISFSRNFGHEAAMIAGIDNANGDGLICMDADLQHPLECITEIIKKFEDGFDVISMVRKQNKSAGFMKNITSTAFYKVINMLSNQAKFEENASDFFGISRTVADVLKNNYRESVRFLRGYVQSVGFKKTTLEYIAADRFAGNSHYSIRKLIKFSINTIVCFSDFPLKTGIYAGVVSAAIGILVLIYSLFTHKGAPDGYTTLITFNSFMFAILFAVIGIIGQYISVLFSEIKSRPIYLIQEKINFDN